jgi:probable O-glycosylation ligase (exosortase A-associated)
LLFVYVAFLGLGSTAPFVATLGYVWVDTFQPQTLSTLILDQIPVSMVMGVFALGMYAASDRRSPPRFNIGTMLQLAMGSWVTIGLVWAEVPPAAFEKWNWAFKTIMFAAFVPYVIRSRVQIEAFAQTYVFSLAANFVPFGLKTMISGGGYGTNLGLQQGNAGLAEGGLLSTVCLMVVPLAVYLSNNSVLMPRTKLVTFAYWAVCGLAITTAIGTYERSALVGLVVLGIYMWLRSKHKFAFGLLIAIIAVFMLYSLSSKFTERISSLNNVEQESSAFVRILVWKWTLGYVTTHPLGGSFNAFLVNTIEVPATDTTPAMVEHGRAFHSIYFEVLGETGIPGMAMFLILAGITFVKLRRLSKQARAYPELQWVVALSDALQSGLAVFMTSGAFVGIAFQPMFWYFVSMSISLNAYMARIVKPHSPANNDVVPGIVRAPVTSTTDSPVRGWRDRAGVQRFAPVKPRR